MKTYLLKPVTKHSYNSILSIGSLVLLM